MAALVVASGRLAGARIRRQGRESTAAGDLEPGLERVRLLRDEARALLGQYWRDGEAKWEELGKGPAARGRCQTVRAPALNAS